MTSISGFVQARARFEEAHPCDARATRFLQHTALAVARLTACFPHAARIDLAPCLAAGCRSARRVLRGTRVARDALQVVAVWTPTPHANGDRSHRISIENIDCVEGDPRFCPDFGCIQPLSGPHRFGTVVGSDSVAERIAPLLLMLTGRLYNRIHPEANKMAPRPRGSCQAPT